MTEKNGPGDLTPKEAAFGHVGPRRSAVEESGKGTDHPDDREPLAYAYDGESLAAVIYNRQAFHLCDGFGPFTVVPTPEGEARLEDT